MCKVCFQIYEHRSTKCGYLMLEYINLLLVPNMYWTIISVIITFRIIATKELAATMCQKQNMALQGKVLPAQKRAIFKINMSSKNNQISSEDASIYSPKFSNRGYQDDISSVHSHYQDTLPFLDA